MVSVAEYISSLTRIGHPIEELLCPPANPILIEDFERQSGLKLPDPIAKLFATHDGTQFSDRWRLGHGQFIEGFYLMGFEEALADKDLIDESIEDYPFVCEQSHAFEGRSLLPFLADGCGDHVVVDIAPDSSHFGYIGTYLHADDSRPDEFQDFDSFLAGHAEALAAGAYRVTSEGYLDATFKELDAILARYKSHF